VPLAAVTRQKDKAFVFKPEESKARRVPVTLGAESGELVEVLDGVMDSDSLLISKAPLGDGMAIAIAGSR
jgi:multidrug efflux pump subunit AcrA (membrane-fusion protein)